MAGTDAENLWAEIETQGYLAGRLSDRPLLVEFGSLGGLAKRWVARPGARAIAFEPTAESAERARRVAGLEVRPVGIAATAGKRRIRVWPDRPQSSSVVPRSDAGEWVAREIDCITPAEALEGLGRVDLLSVDIEGAEWAILKAWSEDTARARRELAAVDQIVVELHPDLSPTMSARAALRTIEDAGFRLHVAEPNPRRPGYHGRRGPSEARLGHNEWLRERLKIRRRWDTMLNLGAGGDGDREGGHYSDWISCRKTIRQDLLAGPRVDLIAPAEAIPLATGSVDLVFCNWTIYKCDMAQAIREIVRVACADADVFLSWGDDSPVRVAEIRRELLRAFEPLSWWAHEYIQRGLWRRAEAIHGRCRP